jgi:hypothetical protein
MLRDHLLVPLLNRPFVPRAGPRRCGARGAHRRAEAWVDADGATPLADVVAAAFAALYEG